MAMKSNQLHTVFRSLDRKITSRRPLPLQNDSQNQKNGNSFGAPRDPPIVIRDAVATYIERIEEEEKLDHLLQQSNRILFQCRTVFPFDFFPDRLIVDETKVNVILKEFFATENVHGILIENIKDIQIQTSIFFASLTIIPDIYFGEPVELKYLHKRDAYEVRKIIQGIIVCQREGIDLSKLDARQVKDKVRKVGTAIGVSAG